MFVSVVAIVRRLRRRLDLLRLSSSTLLIDPYETAVTRLAEEQGLEAEAVITGIANPFILQAKVSLVAGLVIASPVWLYEIWAFIVPGLHPQRAQVDAGRSSRSPVRSSWPASPWATT